MLGLPSTKSFTPRTDASEKGLAAVLLLEHDGKLSPVSYASKRLNDSEKMDRQIEYLAVVWLYESS